MTNALLLFAGIVAASGVILLLDWIGRRRDRQSVR